MANLKTNVILNIIKTCSSVIFPLITFPYVTRVLLPENIGMLQFAQSFVSYFSLLATLGLTVHAVRECSIYRNNRAQLQLVSSQLFSINLLTTIIAYILLAISLIFFQELSNYKLLILIESSSILALTLGTDWINTAMEDIKYITVRTFIFQFISLFLIISFVKTTEDLYIYAIINVFSNAGANISNIVYRKKYCNICFTFNIDWKKHIPPIFSLFGMHMAITIFNCTDVVMLGIMIGDREVGLYSTAYKICRIVSLIVQSLSWVIIPRLTFYFNSNDFQSANKMLRKVLGFNLVLGLPCIVGILFISQDIVLLVGGAEYIESAPVLSILILGFMFTLVGGSFLGNAILIPMKQEKYYMIVCCVSAMLNIVLNAILIPKYGAVGAAIASSFNGVIIAILLFLKVDSRIHIERLVRLVVIPIIGCISIAMCCLLCRFISIYFIRLILSVISSVLVYTLIQILLKNDIVSEYFYSILNKFIR